MRNLLLTFCSGVLLFGQSQVTITPRRAPKRPVSSNRPSLRLDVSVVLVPVSAVDSADRPVLDLSRDRFRIFEDNVEQQISSFAFEEGPVSVGFVFDASSSMRNRMTASVDAVERFLKTASPG